MADNVFLRSRSMVLTKLETTYGVDAGPQPNSFEAIRIIEPPNIELGQEHVEVTGGNLTRGFQRPIGTVRPARVTFRTFLTGIEATTYTAAVKPPASALLRACGLYETFVSSNASGDAEYQYAPAADVGSDQSITVVTHIDGFEHRFTGGRGNVNLIFQAANPVIAEFTFAGQLTTEAATARSAPTIPAISPPRWIGSGTIFANSWQAHVANLNFATNNELLEQRASVAASGSGILQILITRRTPGGSFDPEATEPATLDFFGAWRSSSGVALQLNVGTTKGNRISLVASQVVFKEIGWGDNAGLALFNVNYQAYESSQNDEFVLRFT